MDFELKLMDIGAEQLAIPDTDYSATCVLILPNQGCRAVSSETTKLSIDTKALRNTVSVLGCTQELKTLILRFAVPTCSPRRRAASTLACCKIHVGSVHGWHTLQRAAFTCPGSVHDRLPKV